MGVALGCCVCGKCVFVGGVAVHTISRRGVLMQLRGKASSDDKKFVWRLCM